MSRLSVSICVASGRLKVYDPITFGFIMVSPSNILRAIDVAFINYNENVVKAQKVWLTTELHFLLISKSEQQHLFTMFESMDIFDAVLN